MMNILEQEDIIKGLPDQALMQEAQMPSGQVPQYLVVSEIQRRSDMRKRYKADQGQMPQATVKEQVMQEGIMASMPPQMAMAPQMPQRMPQMPPPQMPPQRMAGGGIVEMSTGGVLEEVLVKAPNLSEQKLEELIIDGVPTVDLIQMGFTSDDISRVGSQIDPRIIREGKKILGAAPDAIYDTLTFDPDRGESIVKRGQEAQQRAVQSAQQSFLGRTDIPRGEDPPKPFRTTFGLPFDFSVEGTKFEPVADLIGSGITSLGNAYDRFMERSDRLAERRADLDTGGQEVTGQGVEVQSSSDEKNSTNRAITDAVIEEIEEADSDTPRMDALRNESVTQVDERPVDDLTEAAVNEGGFADDYRSRLEYLMSLGVDSDKVEIPTLDYSDIRADLDRRTKSNMLFRLAEGIGKGDVASGIGGMSKVAEEAARDISKIDIAERKGRFDAATAAQKRQDSLIKTQRMLGAELMGLSDKLRLDKSVNKRAIINYYADIREGLQDELVALAQFEGSLSPESAALMKQIDRMLQDLGKEYGIELPQIDDGGTNNPAGIRGGGSLGLPLPSRQTAP